MKKNKKKIKFRYITHHQAVSAIINITKYETWHAVFRVLLLIPLLLFTIWVVLFNNTITLLYDMFIGIEQ